MSALNSSAPNRDGRYVLYWMQHAQRAVQNPALELAAARANRLNLPLVVLFVIEPNYPDANARHFTFLLEGLADVAPALHERGVHFALRIGEPCQIVAGMAGDAALLVMDRNYLKVPVAWRHDIAASVAIRVEMVEGEAIVPVDVASHRLETAARTIRPKIRRALDEYVDPAPQVPLAVRASGFADPADMDVRDPAALLSRLPLDDTVGPVTTFRGGYRAARARLDTFLRDHLASYGTGRANMVTRHVSNLAPYLHFGHISPLEVYLAATAADPQGDGTAKFVEELVVRRELAINFVHRNPDYDRWEGLPAWARATLDAHRGDPREALYTPEQLENGATHDTYWNAAMREMRQTGYLHNHMRMYWGKRVLTFMADPAEAQQTLIALNNAYLLDGRDANTYANIAWIFGSHDRGWPERPVYGKVRTMTPSGLERKFDIKAYVRWSNTL